MARGVLFFCICLIMFAVASAKPLPRPENDDGEILAPKDTVYYPFLFWFGRAVYEPDDGGDNTYNWPERKSSTISYADVGAGWGR